MPFVDIRVAGPLTTEQKRGLVEDVTRSLVDRCGKNPATTHIVITEVATENWGNAAILVADRKPREDATADVPR
jgi:4-oxalocrotonate tautomerase